MSKSIYLISPRPDHPWYYTSEVFDAWDFPPGVLVADLALARISHRALGKGRPSVA
jgi:hypothetical protein